MIIDNGRRVRLIIAGLFDGQAGESDGVVSFIPNRSGTRPASARGALLDGAPVFLTLREGPTAGAPFCTYSWRVAQ